jgi:hypothetical protein
MPEALILSLYNASHTRRNIGNVSASGSPMGARRPAWQGHWVTIVDARGRQGVPPGEGVERSTKTLTHPTEWRTTEAKRQFRRGIAERGEDHMKGKKAFIRVARRPSKLVQPAKVLGQIKLRAAELMAEAAT